MGIATSCCSSEKTLARSSRSSEAADNADGFGAGASPQTSSTRRPGPPEEHVEQWCRARDMKRPSLETCRIFVRNTNTADGGEEDDEDVFRYTNRKHLKNARRGGEGFDDGTNNDSGHGYHGSVFMSVTTSGHSSHAVTMDSGGALVSSGNTNAAGTSATTSWTSGEVALTGGASPVLTTTTVKSSILSLSIVASSRDSSHGEHNPLAVLPHSEEEKMRDDGSPTPPKMSISDNAHSCAVSRCSTVAAPAEARTPGISATVATAAGVETIIPEEEEDESAADPDCATIMQDEVVDSLQLYREHGLHRQGSVDTMDMIE